MQCWYVYNCVYVYVLFVFLHDSRLYYCYIDGIAESGIIADISIVSDDGGDGTERSHWNSTLESPTSHLPTTSTPLQSPTSATATATVTSASSSDTNLTPYDQDMSINL